MRDAGRRLEIGRSVIIIFEAGNIIGDERKCKAVVALYSLVVLARPGNKKTEKY